jgi:hypothetical protein
VPHSLVERSHKRGDGGVGVTPASGATKPGASIGLDDTSHGIRPGERRKHPDHERGTAASRASRTRLLPGPGRAWRCRARPELLPARGSRPPQAAPAIYSCGALNRGRNCAELPPTQHENDEHNDYDKDYRPDTDIHRLSFPGRARNRLSMRVPALSSRVAFNPATLTRAPKPLARRISGVTPRRRCLR